MLLERDRAFGAPVAAAKAWEAAAFASSSIRPTRPWVSRRITQVIFWAPDGTEVRVAEGDVGYVLDRTRFEPALAAEAGARAPRS